jgi:hypothetical protein
MFAKQSAAKWPINDPRRQYILNASFESFIRDQRVFPIPEHPGQPWMGPLSSWFNQLEWIKDETGAVMCDCLRLEHIDRDLSAYLGHRIEIQRHNATTKRYDYRSLYNEELINIIGEIFREDIEYFGFSFEGGATRNVLIPV